MLKIIITGAKGRMGTKVAKLVRAAGDLELVADVDKNDSLSSVIHKCDVVIDFSVAEAAANNAATAAAHGKPIVIGTTGLTPDQEKIILAASKKVAIVKSPNMSLGINTLFKLVEIASKVLGKKFKMDIVETHHSQKLDRPSGTAKKILDIALKESGKKVDEDVFFYEENAPRSSDEDETDISVRSIRRGEVVGDHAIFFSGPGEALSINHSAATRDVFAEGAVTAARWIAGKKPGLYGMDDVLGF